MKPKLMPSELRIAGMDWRVDLVPHIPHMKPENKGLTEWEDSAVFIADTGDGPVQRRTLFHEIVHIADIQGELGLSEVQVVAITNNLWAIFADNPDLVVYLFRG